MPVSKHPVAAIVGPTSSGKSELALEVAEVLDAEIISVDSTQIYQGMDIGTAKLLPEHRFSSRGRYIPHHLLDIITPNNVFTVADYQRLAREKITGIRSRGKLPMLVGGTGLYLRATIDNYVFPEQVLDEKLRQRLYARASREGSLALYHDLQRIDPEAAASLHPNDVRRVVRALEFFYTTGNLLSQATRLRNSSPPLFRVALVGLTPPRQQLYAAINTRVDEMISKGLVDEVKSLLHSGINPNSNALQALGYKQLIAYLEGGGSLPEAVDQIKRETRRYAKRQLTWFRHDKRIRWLNPVSYLQQADLVKEIVTVIRQDLGGHLPTAIE